MIPVLFDHSETAFTSNGIGRLVDCIRCEVTEERNGIYECEFDYPITGQHYSDIQIDRIIYVTHDDSQAPQPFDIYRKTAPIDGIVTFYAHHISYRLGNVLLDPFTAPSCSIALARLNLYSMVEHPFTFQTDKNVVAEFSVTVPISIKAVLGGVQGSILDVYGTGEYEYDKFVVKLWLHRGADNGVSIVYSDSLSDLTHDVDFSNSYNTVCPYWANMEKSEIVTLPEKFVFANNAPSISNNWTENGTTVTDDNGHVIEFITSDGKAVPLDLSEAFDEAPSVEDLRARAVSYLANSYAWLPKENLRVDFSALWQTEDYANVAKLQTVKLCDTVTVAYPELGVNAKVEVIKTVYNVLLDRYDEIELGEPTSSFAEVITAQASAEVKESSTFLSSIAGEVDRATNKITGMKGGNVVINSNSAGKPYEILVMDTDNKDTAVNVMRINNAGIGFSTNGYNGPFVSAWTLDGHFVANFIATGTLSADLVRTGVLRSQTGGNYWNLDTGEFYTATSEKAVNIKNGRVYLYDPNDPDFFGSISTYYDNNITAIGMFTTGDYIGFGKVSANGNYTSKITMYTGTVESTDLYKWNKAGVQAGRGYFIYFYNQEQFSDTIHAKDMYVGGGINWSDGSTSQGQWRWHAAGDLYTNRINLVHDEFSLQAAGSITCTSVTQTSDRRKKTVLEWDDRYVDALEDFEPVLFRWVEDPDGINVGLIAQDVKKALEDRGLDASGIVCGSEKLYTLNYFSIFSLMLAKMKRQQKQLNDMEKRLEKIEEMLNENR